MEKYKTSETENALIPFVIKDILMNVTNLVHEEKNDSLYYEAFYEKMLSYHTITCENMKHLKTFLFNYKTVDFDKVYYPLSIIGSHNGNKIIIDNGLTKLFKNKNCITIIGSAGSGKTMLTKRIFLSALKTLKLIPIIVEFRKLEEGESIENYIKIKVLNFNSNNDENKLLKFPTPPEAAGAGL